ncbi:MAG: hypothetical protein IJO53_13220 [Clostridia bacterium]|nr:hypothetical protein [Clostridia bacterium]
MKIKLALLILFLFLLPSSAWASLSIEPSVQPDEDGSYSIVGNGSYIITTNGIETGTAIYLDSLVDEDPENHLIVTLQDFKTNSSFNVKGNVTIVLKGDNTLGFGLSYDSASYESHPCQFSRPLTIEGDGILTAIGETGSPDDPYSSSSGIDLGGLYPELIINNGTIHATGGYGYAGIGGFAPSITINGGSVSAIGGYGSAGIGSHQWQDWVHSAKVHINITGGSVIAQGGYGGAGIGSGTFVPETEHFSSSVSISVNGGSVKANGGTGGAGIGGSGEVYVAITGGEITEALGGASDETLGGGAGIGGNCNSSATVYISGGTISARSTDSGAGIGGGENGDGTVTIIGGSVFAQSKSDSGIGGNSALVAINGGTVQVSSSYVGIGGTFGDSSSGSVTISGGTITATDTDYAICGELITVNGGHITTSGYSGMYGNVIINDGVIYITNNSGHAGIGDSWYDVTINGGIIFSRGDSAIEGNHILITGGQIGSKDFINEGHYGTGINGKHVTITGGDIYVKGGSELAGIGACWEGHCDILITGGTITAYGYERDVSSDSTAGIGNGKSSSDITIEGGMIFAYGGSGIEGNTITINDGTIYAYGVGSQYLSAGGIFGSRLLINGGTIEAVCAGIGPGIGLGSCFRFDRGFDYGYDTELIINGGNITATGGRFCAGIGNYLDCKSAAPIFISGGSIHATGGYHAAGIGGGAGSDCAVTISGGTIHAIGGEEAPGVGSGSAGELPDDDIPFYYGEALEAGVGTVFIQADEEHPLEVLTRRHADSEWKAFNNPITSVCDISSSIRTYSEFRLTSFSK